jgi:hypothetical protein
MVDARIVDARIEQGLRRVAAALAEMRPYETVLAALDEVARMPGADAAGYAIAQTRFTMSWVYERPVAEVEAALVARLAVEDDPVSRCRVAGAAYATHAALVGYFDDAVAALEALPRTPAVERALASAARVYANVHAGKP